ncbi:unnamed protein product [Oppiella nova]|uniref:Small integral membrane protein 20 n=1 Tax=Oppiella nova TaxID=334625 RepID=A0A7R9QZ28_9ACAR|nr:unnamed protein product [Oppiella nova]CAD7663627.1 unnamed protein product [Oppiella nova]CAG2180733.1 unnamed protein product [Oppiella nova]CAG2180764.1 unnamed protein product [Oppiella nova]
MAGKIRMTPVRFGLTMAAFIGAVGAAMYSVFVYPVQHVDYYKERQTANRQGIKQEDIQPGGMRVWSDPFDRKKS